MEAATETINLPKLNLKNLGKTIICYGARAVGKSTLILDLLRHLRNKGITNGLIINPTHKFGSVYDDFVVESDKVDVWEIQRDSGLAWAEATNSVNRRRHYFIIRGFYAVDDSGSSEKTIDNIIEDIIDSLRDYPALDSTAERVSFDPNDPMTWTSTYGYLGPVLCHIIEINFMVQEYTTF